ncbi:MAG: Zn-ribbon domain-containing OB-fold protein [Chloroflexota bacterium]
MATISNKLKQEQISDPLNRTTDPWADFREVEVLGLEWTQNYRHSLGKYSRFFLELENKRFFATRCPKCGQTWVPPRPACPNDLAITEWLELSGQGEVVSFSVLHYAPAMLSHLETPYVLAYIKMDGADTLFAHLLQDYGDLKNVHHGMPVQVVYSDGPVDHPIMLMAFAPR